VIIPEPECPTEGSGLQAADTRLSTLCVTRAYAAVLVAVATVIPRISLTEPIGEHLIRRSEQQTVSSWAQGEAWAPRLSRWRFVWTCWGQTGVSRQAAA
jgi:hypothetical protein